MIEKKLKDISLVYWATERTGTYEGVDQFIEIGAIKTNFNGEVIERFSELIKVSEEDVPNGILERMDLTIDFINENGKSYRDVIFEFKEFCEGSILIGHHIVCDIVFLIRDTVFLLSEENPIVFLDIADFAKRMYPFLANYKIQTLCWVLLIDYDINKYYMPYFKAKIISEISNKIFLHLKFNGDMTVKEMIAITKRPFATLKQREYVERLFVSNRIKYNKRSNYLGFSATLHINSTIEYSKNGRDKLSRDSN